MLTPAEIRELLDYAPLTGVLRWRCRPREFFASNASFLRWNAVRGNKIAGHVDSRGYRRMELIGERVSAHRAAWAHYHGTWPKMYVDHANGDKTDNRIINLREATAQQNAANSRRHQDSSCSHKGVTFDVSRQKWRASLKRPDGRRYIGRYPTKEQAAAAYAEVAKEVFGEFARLA